MTIQEVYDQYKHLPLDDRDMLPESFWEDILWDLWQAIKQENERRGKLGMENG